MQQTFSLLQQLRFREASVLVAAYESQQVFPRGLGVDWAHHDCREDVWVLQAIHTAKPRILSSLAEAQWAPLRRAAGMMHLWSLKLVDAWLPPEMETRLHLGRTTAARMLVFHADHLRSLAEIRAAGSAKSYRIIASTDPCPQCKRIAGRVVPVAQYFELPYEHCTDELGCRCSILGNVRV